MIKNDQYPTPKMTEGRDEVFIGRIRTDASIPNGFWFWVVANNVRKEQQQTQFKLQKN